MLDLHSHILPGLDDGASDWDQSLAMARVAVEDGVEGVVCTPHWVLGHYDNTRPVVLSALERLQEKLAAHSIPLEIYPGAELHLDVSLARRLQDEELLTINGTGRYALLELPRELLPQNLEDFLWDLQINKITPVISHPERNLALRQDPSRLYRWVHMGVLAQLTAASLLGRFGRQVQRFSVLLLHHRLVHILGTDAHGLRGRTPRLSQACKVIEEIRGKEAVRQMTSETPRHIIQGERVTPEEPVPVRPRSFSLASLKRFFPFVSRRQPSTLRRCDPKTPRPGDLNGTC